MKKTLFYVGAALAIAFSLTGCQKEIQNPEENNEISKGSPFEIIANPVETRTTNDGLNTKWAAGDAIAVFHAETGTTSYKKDGEFTISEAGLASNRFSGEVSETLAEDKTYDWYMIYPYASQYTTPANTSAGYTTVGSKSSGSQTQNGNNSTAHLAGANYPLLGKVSNVGNATMPSVDVNQACSFIEFNVTNNSGADLVVSQVSFTATEPIVGTYYINYADINNVEFTASGNSYVSNVAKLNVDNGVAIANEESAKFYIGIKPFSASSGTLKVAVNGYEKEISLTKTTSFSAGKIKKINFNYDQEPKNDYVTLDWVFPEEEDESATLSALNLIGGVTTNSIGEYAAANAPYQLQFNATNDYILVKTDVAIGSVSLDYKMIGGANTSYFDIYQSVDGEEWGENPVQRLTVSGAQNSTGTITTSNAFSSNSRYVKINFVKGSNIGIGRIAILMPSTNPVIVADDISVPATGATSATASYEARNFTDDVTVVGVGGCVTSATISNGNILYSVNANYDSSAKSGTITLQSEANPSLTKTINVSQLKSTLEASPTEVIIPSSSDNATFIVKSPEFDWTISSSSSDVTLSKTSGAASEDPVTITVSSSVSSSSETQDLAVLTIVRTSDDPQAKQVHIRKANASTESVLYTANFNAEGEHRPSSSTNSYGENEYTVSGVIWSLSSADITTTGTPLEGEAHLIARNPKNSGATTATAVTGNLLSSAKEITKITFLSAPHTNSTLSVQYSLNGTNWTTLTINKDTNVSSSNGYSATVSGVTSTSDFRLKFSWTSTNNTNSNRDSKLDDIRVYGK